MGEQLGKLLHEFTESGGLENYSTNWRQVESHLLKIETMSSSMMHLSSENSIKAELLHLLTCPARLSQDNNNDRNQIHGSNYLHAHVHVYQNSRYTACTVQYFRSYSQQKR